MSEYNELPGTDSAKTIMCIVARILRRGDGKETPIRIVTQVFTAEGELIAEDDPGACKTVSEVCQNAITLLHSMKRRYGIEQGHLDEIDGCISDLKTFA